MKHIYLNLKRFDIPTETGGVNRIASPAEWGPYIVSHTQDQLAAYNPKDVRVCHVFPGSSSDWCCFSKKSRQCIEDRTTECSGTGYSRWRQLRCLYFKSYR